MWECGYIVDSEHTNIYALCRCRYCPLTTKKLKKSLATEFRSKKYYKFAKKNIFFIENYKKKCTFAIIKIKIITK